MLYRSSMNVNATDFRQKRGPSDEIFKDNENFQKLVGVPYGNSEILEFDLKCDLNYWAVI